MNGNNENSLDADWVEPERLQQELSLVFDSRRLALSRVGDLLAKQWDLQAELETVQAERDDLDELNRVKNVQISNLHENGRETETERRRLVAELETAQAADAQATVRENLAASKYRLGVVQAELETVQGDRDDLMVELDRRQAEIDEYGDGLETAQAELETEREALAESQYELSRARSELETAQAELATLRSEKTPTAGDLVTALTEKEMQAELTRRATAKLETANRWLRRTDSFPVEVALETLKRALDDLWQIHCGPDADAATQHPEGHEEC